MVYLTTRLCIRVVMHQAILVLFYVAALVAHGMQLGAAM